MAGEHPVRHRARKRREEARRAAQSYHAALVLRLTRERDEARREAVYWRDRACEGDPEQRTFERFAWEHSR